MARIRTIKPDFFKHETLFDAETESGLPLRLSFAGLWTQCDREGRFEWRPRKLKADILPYDDIDFSRVLDALAARGFIVKYASGENEYGCIPSWKRHQVINNRESDSNIPQPPENKRKVDASATRGSRDTENSKRNKEGEGEGEGEGNGMEDTVATATRAAAEKSPEPKPAENQTGNGSDEDRFWGMAERLRSIGVSRGQMGELANLLNGDFEQAVGILLDVIKANKPRSYIGGIIHRLKSENVVPFARPDPGVPNWVQDARQQGYPVNREGKRWRMAGALYDEIGEQVGC